MNHFVCMMKRNRWYSNPAKIPMTGIVVHSTGANNPELKRYVQPTQGDPEYWEHMKKLGTNSNGNDWNWPTQPYGMHAFVGKLSGGSVASVQVLPWDKFLYGCGTGRYGSYNSQYIQFEICEDTGDRDYTIKAYREAVELCAMLCKKFDIPVGNIVSHNEAHDLGYASSHADPEHWWNMYALTMDGFRRDVQNVIDGFDWEEVDEVRYNTVSEMPLWARDTIQKLINKGFLQGTGEGLGLTNDMIRMLVILDRAGVFG